jgi:hypothetical protein
VASLTMRVYGVVSERLGEAIEIFADRREAERVVQNYDYNEPERSGELFIEPVELDTSLNCALRH